MPGRFHDGAGEYDARHSGVGLGPSDILNVSATYDPAGYQTAHLLLATKLNSLMMDMVANPGNYEENFIAIYNDHQTADLRLNSLSIEMTAADSGSIIGDGVQAIATKYSFSAAVHIHTGYANGPSDSHATTTLLDIIMQYLDGSRNLLGGYWITRVSHGAPGEEFTDSATTGGHLDITIEKIGGYLQS